MNNVLKHVHLEPQVGEEYIVLSYNLFPSYVTFCSTKSNCVKSYTLQS